MKVLYYKIVALLLLLLGASRCMNLDLGGKKFDLDREVEQKPMIIEEIIEETIEIEEVFESGSQNFDKIEKLRQQEAHNKELLKEIRHEERKTKREDLRKKRDKYIKFDNERLKTKKYKKQLLKCINDIQKKLNRYKKKELEKRVDRTKEKLDNTRKKIKWCKKNSDNPLSNWRYKSKVQSYEKALAKLSHLKFEQDSLKDKTHGSFFKLDEDNTVYRSEEKKQHLEMTESFRNIMGLANRRGKMGKKEGKRDQELQKLEVKEGSEERKEEKRRMKKLKDVSEGDFDRDMKECMKAFEAGYWEGKNLAVMLVKNGLGMEEGEKRLRKLDRFLEQKKHSVYNHCAKSGARKGLMKYFEKGKKK